MPVNGCCCGTSTCPTCDPAGLTAGELLGTPYNANRTVIRIGGTGDPAKPFPRYPRWSTAQQKIIPTVCQTMRAAFLHIYPCATHDGTKYSVNNACRSVQTTRYKGCTANHKKRTAIMSGDAYSENAQRFGYDYNDAPSYPSAYYAGYRNLYEPFVWGSGEKKLYGGRSFIGVSDGNNAEKYNWLTLTDGDLTTVYNILSDDIELPAAGVPHTLILYFWGWRSLFKTLPGWDGVSVPAWWYAPGPSDFGSTAEAVITTLKDRAWFTAGHYLGTGGPTYGDYDPREYCLLIEKSNNWPSGMERFANGVHTTGDSGGSVNLGNGTPTTVADTRVLLLSAHIIRAQRQNLVISNLDSTWRPSQIYPPDSAPYSFPNIGDYNPTIICEGNTDIRVQAVTTGAVLTVPTIADSWAHAGTPYAATDFPYDLSPLNYYVPITFDTPFPGVRSTTLNFGGRSYTLKQTS